MLPVGNTVARRAPAFVVTAFMRSVVPGRTPFPRCRRPLRAGRLFERRLQGSVGTPARR